MRIIKYYDDSLAANIDREKLESEGITAVVLNEYANSVIPLGQVISSLRPHVVVADEDLDRAMVVLGIANDVHPKTGVCPECGADEWRFMVGGRSGYHKFLIKFIFIPIAVLSGNPLGNIHGKYYCRKCGHEFHNE